MNTPSIRFGSMVTFVLLFLAGGGPARAQGRKVAQETADYLLQRFGREAAREGATTLARKIEIYAARHGDEFLKAVRQVGPRTFHLIDEAGAHGNQAVRVLAMHGEHGATWVVTRPKGMQLFLQHGDEAAAMLVRHKGIAEPVIDRLGRPAIKALQATNTQSCRRLGMMLESGEFARLGRSQEVLDVIGRYGDRAMNFVWEHKGALATAAGLTAFLANPEAFINGTAKMAQIVGENAIKPVVTEVARGTNWTIIFLAVGAVVFGCFAVKYFHLGDQLGQWIRAKFNVPQEAVRAATAKTKTDTTRKDPCHRKESPAGRKPWWTAWLKIPLRKNGPDKEEPETANRR
jgi:hypothetical protein